MDIMNSMNIRDPIMLAYQMDYMVGRDECE